MVEDDDLTSLYYRQLCSARTEMSDKDKFMISQERNLPKKCSISLGNRLFTHNVILRYLGQHGQFKWCGMEPLDLKSLCNSRSMMFFLEHSKDSD